MAPSLQSAFTLRLGAIAEGDVAVVSFRGHEDLSRCYRFDVVFRTSIDVLAVEPNLLGSRAELEIAVPDRPARVVPGIVAALSSEGVAGDGRRQLTVRIAPRLWIASRRRNSRIFQDKSLVDVVDAVLGEHAVPHRWCLASKPPIRAYAVQYRETDLELVGRLLAEAGLFYYFDLVPSAEGQNAGQRPLERMVICDRARHYPALLDQSQQGADDQGQTSETGKEEGSAEPSVTAPVLPFAAEGSGLVGGEAIHTFGIRRSIRAESMAVRDYDFERPLLELSAGLSTGLPGASSGDQSSGGVRAGGVSRLEIYEHHGEYSEHDVTQNHAALQLEQYRARAVVGRGTSSARRLSPGRRFSLEGGEGIEASDARQSRELAVIRVRHRGTSAAFLTNGGSSTYENSFECVPADIAYRPRRPKRDLSQVLESAIVVGPGEETIHTDRFGRIKVRFHWDRESTGDDRSSCWMRVSQAWAGAGWGAQFIPRVGMEVLVGFLGGDEDRPVVTGCLYNATHPLPFPVPANRSRSGIRSQSLDGGGGSEISFEDAGGAEVMHLAAQRDLHQHVRHDHRLAVEGNQDINVTGTQRQEVGGERHDAVTGSETRSVGGSKSENVARHHHLTIGGRKVENIAQSWDTKVHGVVLQNTGSHAVSVDGFATVNVGGDDEPRALAVSVNGETSLGSTTVQLEAEKAMSLSCGDSRIELSPDAVRIDAKTIILRAQEKLILFGDGPAIELSKGQVEVLSDEIRMFSKGGSMELDNSAAHLDGPLVLLNCGKGDKTPIEDDTIKPTTQGFSWVCRDEDLKPYANANYRLVVPGHRYTGITDGGGAINLDLPSEAKSAYLTLWVGDFPQSKRVHFSIRLDALPPASSILGAQLRLKNLGYYLGTESDEMTSELGAAVLEFQSDHGLAPSGRLDAATALKLEEIHPT